MLIILIELTVEKKSIVNNLGRTKIFIISIVTSPLYIYLSISLSCKGEWSNDKKNGKGKYTWTDGRSYTGNFKNGLRYKERFNFFTPRVHGFTENCLH